MLFGGIRPVRSLTSVGVTGLASGRTHNATVQLASAIGSLWLDEYLGTNTLAKFASHH